MNKKKPVNSKIQNKIHYLNMTKQKNSLKNTGIQTSNMNDSMDDIGLSIKASNKLVKDTYFHSLESDSNSNHR